MLDSLKFFAIYISFLFALGVVFATDPNYKTFPYMGQCTQLRPFAIFQNTGQCDQSSVRTIGVSSYAGIKLIFQGVMLEGNCVNKLVNFEHKDVVKYFECKK